MKIPELQSLPRLFDPPKFIVIFMAWSAFVVEFLGGQTNVLLQVCKLN